VSAESLPAQVEDVHQMALGMPHVTLDRGPSGNPVYQVGGKSFAFFRTPRADAHDPANGERFSDVIVLWVASESEKHALVQDATTPFFTTALRGPLLCTGPREPDRRTHPPRTA